MDVHRHPPVETAPQPLQIVEQEIFLARAPRTVLNLTDRHVTPVRRCDDVVSDGAPHSRLDLRSPPTTLSPRPACVNASLPAAVSANGGEIQAEQGRSGAALTC